MDEKRGFEELLLSRAQLEKLSDAELADLVSQLSQWQNALERNVRMLRRVRSRAGIEMVRRRQAAQQDPAPRVHNVAEV